MNTIVIRSAEFCGPEDGIVDSAQRIATAVVDAARDHESVTVSMDRVLGASSSFFNVLLSELVMRLGSEAIGTRIQVTGLTRTQQTIFERSRAAVLRSFS
ncbi:MAG: STAS-like domain-containing protein [Planctomycetes bacterium]|nr:STAS-like domain-containing protein [Planctomycetota bacterium]